MPKLTDAERKEITDRLIQKRPLTLALAKRLVEHINELEGRVAPVVAPV